MQRTRIAIAGASGFVGIALCEHLRQNPKYEIVALSRRTRADDRWNTRACDLYSLLDIEQALQGCHIAIYLVHSMSVSARLTQATFQDLDLILADNFARAAQRNGVQHIIYLSGLIPDGDSAKRSAHLESRLEVERTLAAYTTNVTTLRAGLVVGPGGSSLRILTRLVRRLPVMLTPRWTKSLTQPIALQDVLRAFDTVLSSPADWVGSFDIGGPDRMSYRELMARTAQHLGYDRKMFAVPVFTPGLSSLWVALITQTPQELVGPLIQSLRYDMIVHPNPLQSRLEHEALSFEAALKAAAHVERSSPPKDSNPRKKIRKKNAPSTARSVQRLDKPQNVNARWVAQEYLSWLSKSSFGLIQTERDGDCVTFRVAWLGASLLVLRYSSERSCDDRALFYVDGGLLADTSGHRPARLEFRALRTSNEILAAVHDFCPRLPWYVYKYSQAIVHAGVMHWFGRHLRRCDGKAGLQSAGDQ